MKQICGFAYALTPVRLGAGFKEAKNGSLRIVRAHPAQIDTMLINMGDSKDFEFRKSFDFAFFRDTSMALSKAECWEFDGESAKCLAVISDLAIPNGYEQ